MPAAKPAPAARKSAAKPAARPVGRREKPPEPSSHALNCPSRSKIHAYIAQHHLEELCEDLVAFCVFHKPEKPWSFLVKHVNTIISKLRDGVAAAGLLKQFDPTLAHTDETPPMPYMDPPLPDPTIEDNPGVYNAYLEKHSIKAVLQDAIRSLTVALPTDPYQALVEFFQEQALVREG